MAVGAFVIGLKSLFIFIKPIFQCCQSCLPFHLLFVKISSFPPEQTEDLHVLFSY